MHVLGQLALRFLKLLFGALGCGGLIVILAGGGLLLSEENRDTAGGAVLVIVGIIGLTGVYAFFKFSDFVERELRRRYRVGVGRLRDYEVTKLIGDHTKCTLVLDVESEDGHRFVGTLKARFPHWLREDLYPGMYFPIAFDPNTPDKLRIPHGELINRAQLFFNYVQHREGLIDQETLIACLSGISTGGKVMRISPTGRRKDQQSQYELDVMVFRENGVHVKSKALIYLSSGELHRVEMSPMVDVNFNPSYPRRCAISVPAVDPKNPKKAAKIR